MKSRGNFDSNSESRVCLQDPALPGVRVVPDDGAEGYRKAGWLVEDLHRLHAKRCHWELGLCHLPALQSRGTSRQ